MLLDLPHWAFNIVTLLNVLNILLAVHKKIHSVRLIKSFCYPGISKQRVLVLLKDIKQSDRHTGPCRLQHGGLTTAIRLHYTELT